MNKIVKRILEMYLQIFSLFSFVCVNIVICKILKYFGILNEFTGFMVLIITIFSFTGWIALELKGKETNKSNINRENEIEK